MSPVHFDYNTANFQKMLSFVSESHLIYYSWSYTKGVVTYTFDYTSTVDN
jgi:hypothetical protein